MGSVASVRIYFNLATHRDQRIHQALTAYARAQGISLARAGKDVLEAYLVLGGGGLSGTTSHTDMPEASTDVPRAAGSTADTVSPPDGDVTQGVDGLFLRVGYIREAPIEPAGRGNDAAPPHGITVRSGTRGATDLTPACSPYNRPPGTGTDVGEGEPEGFSLPAGDDRHFVTRSRVFSPAELAALRGSAEGEPSS